jgi:hypothetical protein
MNRITRFALSAVLLATVAPLRAQETTPASTSTLASIKLPAEASTSAKAACPRKSTTR